ncbi:MAG: pyridoxal phosphate-dependent aminotransferase [Alphaproteobacteria bacterium]|nr:pyridoxal phosphate-dependent aminotransferase [Alphaproteobacteria bacterium]
MAMRFAARTEHGFRAGLEAWSVIGHAREAAARGEDVINLSIGDPDFDSPQGVIETAVTALRSGRTHYTPAAGIPELRAAIASYHMKIARQPCGPGNVVVFPGSQSALFHALQVLLDPGTEAILLDPAYSTYEGCVQATGAKAVLVPLDADNGFHLDIEAIRAAVTERTRVILVNTPNNPTGTCFTRGELYKLGEIAMEHNLWIISDEVYGPLTFEGEHVSPAAIRDIGDRVITCSSLSKSHAMTGWRVGWAVAPDEVVRRMIDVAQVSMFGYAPFIQDAAVAALTQPQPELETIRETFRERRDVIVRRLNQIEGITCDSPHGGMFAMADVRGTGIPSFDFAMELFKEQKVAVVAGDAFGPAGSGFLRIAFTTPADRMAEAGDRIAAFVRNR